MTVKQEKCLERDVRKARDHADINQHVAVKAGPVTLDGELYLPGNSSGLVVFVHGSDSSRTSPRNQFIASALQQAGLGTLLFDLLTPEEEEIDLRTHHLRFDIGLLARRTIGAADWLREQGETRGLKFGFFGASTGAAAALITAAERPEITGAVVSRGGRPDLANDALPLIQAPTLFIVGQLDFPVIQMNEQSLQQMNPKTVKEITIVPGATHLFEEPGGLEYVAHLATGWFTHYLCSEADSRNKN